MISDKPMEEAGIKTTESDKQVTKLFVEEHVMLGIESLKEIIEGKATRYIRFSW